MAIYNIAAILGVSTAGILLIISTWLPAIVMTSMISVMGFISILLMWRLTVVKEPTFDSSLLQEEIEISNSIQISPQ